MDDASQHSSPEPMDSYMSLTHIGWDWDVSNRTLGKELEQVGYWSHGTPTQRALDEGLAIRRKGSGYQWSRERVGKFIQRSGCSERDKPLTGKRFLVIPIIIE